MYIQGESKKSMICGTWSKIVNFVVQLSCMVFFPMAQKKNPQTFFFLKSNA